MPLQDKHRQLSTPLNHHGDPIEAAKFLMQGEVYQQVRLAIKPDGTFAPSIVTQNITPENNKHYWKTQIFAC